MKLRKAQPKDSPELAKMNHGLIRDEGHRNPMNLSQLSRRMKGWLKSEYKGYVFEEVGLVIGYCVYREEDRFFYIRQFYIKPEFRRNGLGRQAFELLRKKVWKNRHLLRLDVLVKNIGGIRFWRAVGFKDYCLTLERKNK